MFDPLPSDLAGAVASNRERLGEFAAMRFASVVDSTNDSAMVLAESGVPAGTSVLADEQRGGRGRLGRLWFSPPEVGLYLSCVLRPTRRWRGASLIALGAGVAAAHAVRRVTGLPVELKWPNDLVVGRPWRKLGGILCETSGQDAVVVGIGINMKSAAYPKSIALVATSIEAELGRSIERAPVVVEILDELRRLSRSLNAGETDAVRVAWRKLAGPGLAGTQVSWSDGAAERRGRPRDIDPDGALLVETNVGMERLVAGDIRWGRLSGD